MICSGAPSHRVIHFPPEIILNFFCPGACSSAGLPASPYLAQVPHRGFRFPILANTCERAEVCLHGPGTMSFEGREFKQRCVVPVVGFPLCDFALDSVSNDREKLLSELIGWIAQLQLGFCIYAGIGIAAGCFESTEIHFACSIEVARIELMNSGIHRAFPWVLAHASEKAASLAADAPLLAQIQQHRFCLVTSSQPVQSKPELLANHHRIGEWPHEQRRRKKNSLVDAIDSLIPSLEDKR